MTKGKLEEIIVDPCLKKSVHVECLPRAVTYFFQRHVNEFDFLRLYFSLSFHPGLGECLKAKFLGSFFPLICPQPFFEFSRVLSGNYL